MLYFVDLRFLSQVSTSTTREHVGSKDALSRHFCQEPTMQNQRWAVSSVLVIILSYANSSWWHFLRGGRCTTVNTCYPYFRLARFKATEQWVMGTLNTCKTQRRGQSYVRISSGSPTRPSTSKVAPFSDLRRVLPVRPAANQEHGQGALLRRQL